MRKPTKKELVLLNAAIFEKISARDPIEDLRASITVSEFTINKMYEDMPPGKTNLLLEDAKRRLAADKQKLRRLEEKRK